MRLPQVRRLTGMSDVDRRWAERIRAGDRRALQRQFRHEAEELHRLLSKRQGGVHPPWRDFRSFLADVGPSPGPAYKLVSTDVHGAYGPQTVRWALQAGKVTAAPATPQASADSSCGQWTVVAGMPVQYADLPARLGLSFAALSAAISAGCPLETLIAQAEHAKLGDAQAQVADLAWFSDNASHQQAFRDAFMAWRRRISPRHLDAATPQFLYLFMLLPTMARCKASLLDAGLWDPVARQARDLRDASPVWIRFNELLPKAMVVLRGFDIYRQYSLTDEIAELSERVIEEERRFRSGRDEPRRPQAAAA